MEIASRYNTTLTGTVFKENLNVYMNALWGATRAGHVIYMQMTGYRTIGIRYLKMWLRPEIGRKYSGSAKLMYILLLFRLVHA